MRKPENAFSAKFNAYFKDFGFDFWVALGISLSVIACLFVYLNKYDPLHLVRKWHLGGYWLRS